ncbi:putative large membrane protein (plasmid) [Streptomyces alboflavus]|uniref:Putative large membrane protein n=1 Tax=Streptomyces alboflavus TaxID=67267 RepID=A0A291W3T7_9ACTN|nr:bacterial transcriptional activator domain-containing protein [Streptomyces alboflavus]ATM24678.1 putative large membrane protein [Streptomyces alboflavus]
MITAAEEILQQPGTWLVPAAPGAQVELPGLDLTITLQRLDAAAYAPLLELLATANSTEDHPAPPWTDPHQPDAGPGTDVPDRALDPAPEPDDSGLAWQATAAGPAVQVHVTAASPNPAAALPDFSTLAPRAETTAADEPEAAPAPDDEEDLGGLSPETAGTSADPQDAPGTAHEPADGPAVPDEPEPDYPAHPQQEQDGWTADEDSALSPAVAGPAVPDTPPFPQDPYEEEPVDFEEVFAEVLGEQHGHTPFDVPAQADDPAGQEPVSPGTHPADGGTDVSPDQREEPGPAPESTVREPEPPLARVTAVTSSVLAALNTPPDPPAAPQIRILGSVDVAGALGRVESNRRNTLTEIAAWLVLHPGRNRHELDEAIWPGQRVLAGTRNTAISKLRTWLGRDPRLPAEAPDSSYLPPIHDGVYTFNQDVTADWHQFKDLYRTGMHHQGEEADTALAHALALVRGRPFSDIDQSRYVWAEHDIQEMISATVDVAHELAQRRMTAGDLRAAASAASIGLTCDIQAELLYRDLFQIYSATGDRAGIERTAHQLNRISTETGLDSSPETVALLNSLLAASSLGAVSA